MASCHLQSAYLIRYDEDEGGGWESELLINRIKVDQVLVETKNPVFRTGFLISFRDMA